MNQGIFIDIFPMDNVKPSSILGNIHNIMYRCGFILISSMNKSRCYKTKNNLTKYMRLMLYYFTKIIPKKSMHRVVDKVICMFNSKETTYVACITNGDSNDIINKFTIKKDTFYNSIEWEFEGHMFPIPKEYDYVLTKNYGDYMVPPPLEEQEPHHGIIEVCFDTRTESCIKND